MKKTNSMLFLMGGLFMTLLPSCASIVSKSKYDVTINSVPQNSLVRVVDRRGNEVASGETPVTFKLKASAGFFKPAKYTLQFSKEGYEDLTVPLGASFDPWYLGNLLFGGIIGFVVDPATGAMWRIEDDMHNVRLNPKAQPIAQIKKEGDESGINVYALNDIPEEWKAKLVEVKK